MTTETKTISLIPTWRAAASIYIMALENGTPEGQQMAKQGILEMAERFDTYIEQMAEQNEMAKHLIPDPAAEGGAS